MKTTNNVFKAFMLLGIMVFNQGCAGFFDPFYLEAGGNMANQSVGEEYNGDYGDYRSNEASEQTTSSAVQQQSASDNRESQKAIPGFFVGAHASKEINQKLLATGGLRFSTKGSETETSSVFSTKTRLSYIDIPLELQYNIRPKLFVHGGVLPSFLVGANRTTEFEGNSTESSVMDDYKSFDLAGTIGAGYQFNDQFSLSFSYDHGLLEVSNLDYRSVRNRVFRLGLRYKIKGL
ncbi:porin family protein [Winogradskyella sp.]|uniref:porin family protein n=1 Tax=Winogradskyella sp. TaxID=1883156 RepID=UPI003BAB2FBF